MAEATTLAAERHLTNAPPPSLSSNLSAYFYRPLETLTTIRILRLAPGEGDEPLHGQILLTDLKGRWRRSLKQEGTEDTFSAFLERFPHRSGGARHKPWTSYEAISYVWGKPLFTSTLWTSEGGIPMTTNLAVALHQTRRKDKPRNLWADAICINQNDLEEKGHQVKNMGQVYSKAEGVLICLGADFDIKAEKTFSFLNACYLDMVTEFLDPDTELRFKTEMDMFLKLPWFERVWVVQELILAHDAIFIWGLAQLRASIVQRLVMEHVGHNGHWLSLREESPGLTRLDPFFLLNVLHSARNLHCQDNRDRIYAFLSLPYADRTNAPRTSGRITHLSTAIRAIRPNYSDTVERVFTDVASICVQSYEVVRLLKLVDHDGDIPMDLPSWVPDWRRPIRARPMVSLEEETRTSYAMPESPFPESYSALVDRSTSTLRIRGVEYDCIRTISQSDCSSLWTSVDGIAHYWSLFFQSSGEECAAEDPNRHPDIEVYLIPKLLDLCWPSGVSSTNWQEFATRIASDTMFNVESLATSFDNVLLVRSMLLALQAKRSKDSDFFPSSNVYNAYCIGLLARRSWWIGRRMFVTRGGALGWGPMVIRSDDQIVLLEGWDETKLFWAVVRPRDDGYTFVGTAFVPMHYGFGMEGGQNKGLDELVAGRLSEIKVFRLI